MIWLANFQTFLGDHFDNSLDPVSVNWTIWILVCNRFRNNITKYLVIFLAGVHYCIQRRFHQCSSLYSTREQNKTGMNWLELSYKYPSSSGEIFSDKKEKPIPRLLWNLLVWWKKNSINDCNDLELTLSIIYFHHISLLLREYDFLKKKIAVKYLWQYICVVSMCLACKLNG